MPSNALYLAFLEQTASVPVTIGAGQFTVNGVPAASFEGLGPSAYSMLYLNGVPQEQNIYTLTPTSVTIDPDGATLFAGTPIMVQIVSLSVEITGS
ncbi:DUF4183 domain-containing protein [Cohnella rhizosphaerae]|uniref:DUF4183 domain-containing protein n=1 Tax=Cohnella rhizosphaerae TaxID=1457232 RepID=A0A9X4QSI1_9BACL|nr:DUF4183 domain-containing protein [Cohnella rhizosphaerae]MDG0809339.1 DUF4183 domain-containing protein [Cohnella rhizosphaerae]